MKDVGLASCVCISIIAMKPNFIVSLHFWNQTSATGITQRFLWHFFTVGFDVHSDLCVLLYRVLLRVRHNTLYPSAVLKSTQMDRVDSEMYRRRMQRWNLSHARVKRLPVCAENPGLGPSTASVVSWPPTHTTSQRSAQQSWHSY